MSRSSSHDTEYSERIPPPDLHPSPWKVFRGALVLVGMGAVTYGVVRTVIEVGWTEGVTWAVAGCLAVACGITWEMIVKPKPPSA